MRTDSPSGTDRNSRSHVGYETGREIIDGELTTLFMSSILPIRGSSFRLKGSLPIMDMEFSGLVNGDLFRSFDGADGLTLPFVTVSLGERSDGGDVVLVNLVSASDLEELDEALPRNGLVGGVLLTDVADTDLDCDESDEDPVDIDREGESVLLSIVIRGESVSN